MLTLRMTLLLAALAWPLAAECQTYAVTERLAVYPEPPPFSAEAEPPIGYLTPEMGPVQATGLSLEDGGTRWREVRFASGSGWVDAAGLGEAGFPELPLPPLTCTGTEPFWHLGLDTDGITVSRMESETPQRLIPAGERPAHGYRSPWRLDFAGSDGAMTLVLDYTRDCSDGMSDLTYDFTLYALGLFGEGSLGFGCCLLAGD